MSENAPRADPVVPLLASAVVAVVLGSILFVFYPQVSRLLASREGAVTGGHAPADTKVPLWVCRTVEGTAIFLEPFPSSRDERLLQESLLREPRFFLLLSVYNFAGPEVVTIDMPAGGFTTPEGGTAATPAAALLRSNLPRQVLSVLHGLGAVSRLEVARGRTGQALLVAFNDPRFVSSFVSGTLVFERREVSLGALASWRRLPDMKRFLEFS